MLRFAVAVLVAVLSVAALADGQKTRADRVALPTIKIEQGDACVAPTSEMRRDHMKFLLHQRDRTVHQGLREPRHSLKNCVDCHASRESGSVLGKDGFCASCHAYASVSIDCFECHTPLRQRAATKAPK
ncbi:MAG: hypothetical protein AMJ64_11215 [Betaproteobacteria bacterium SG8_39]|nr:MAG: hypothetical protein AMJ64_11215 [Betaproteobacteria bacterium SG8_39]